MALYAPATRRAGRGRTYRAARRTGRWREHAFLACRLRGCQCAPLPAALRLVFAMPLPAPVGSCVRMHIRVCVRLETNQTREYITTHACKNSLARTHTIVRLNTCTHARQDMSSMHTHTHTHETGLHENNRSCCNVVFSDASGNLGPDLQQNLGFKDGP